LVTNGIFIAANPNGIQIHQPRVGGPRRQGEERLPWETVPTNSSTLKALHPIRRRPATTPSELFSFCPFTQRSPTASANAGLKAATALRLVLRAGPSLRTERNLYSHPCPFSPQPSSGLRPPSPSRWEKEIILRDVNPG